MSEITEDFIKSLLLVRGIGYGICEDALVHLWDSRDIYFMPLTLGAFVGLISAPFTNFVTKWNGYYDSLSLCPASGRFMYPVGHERRKLVVADLF